MGAFNVGSDSLLRLAEGKEAEDHKGQETLLMRCQGELPHMEFLVLSCQNKGQGPCQSGVALAALPREAQNRRRAVPMIPAWCRGATRTPSMLYQINTMLCALVCISAVVFGRGVAAQNGDVLSPRAPSAVQTMETFRQIEPWIRSLDVPEDAEGPAVGGACVTLRLRGTVVGRGVAIGRGTSTVADAARLAIDDARDDLAPTNDLDAAERALLEAGSLTIALELAGAPVPIEETTYTAFSAAISPGMEAVAVGLGRQADAVFPLEMLFTGQQPGAAASRLVSRLSGDAMIGSRQPAELVAGAGASFFRLRSTAVAQISPTEQPRVLYRGGRLVNVRDVSSRAKLERFAQDLAAWLGRHEGTGTYLPTNDSVLESANGSTAALRAFALARSASVLGMPEAQFVRDHVEALDSQDPIARALIAVARLELAMDPQIDAMHADDMPRVGQAILAYALARTGDHEAAARHIAELRSVDNASQLVGVMPWLGWAEIELAEGDIPSAIALRQMRDIVTDFQLTATDAGADNMDLVGGVVFTSGAVPLPTWQSARPLAFLATMLRDDRLTEPGEIDAELVQVLRGMRFLRQLSASETESFMYRNPAEAAGGVRAATWDQRMPIDASAMTLLAVLEMLESLDFLAEMEAEEVSGER